MPYYGPPINQPNNAQPFTPGQNQNANTNYGKNAKKNKSNPNGDQEQTSDPNYNGPDKNTQDNLGNNGGGGGGDAESWYRDVIQAQPDKYDTNISKDVWLSWFPDWNPKTKKFKSQKVDGNGQPFGGNNAEADKPTDCPEGTQAWGDSMCLPPGDRRLQAGQQQGGAPTTKASAAPVTMGKAGSLSLTGMRGSFFPATTNMGFLIFSMLFIGAILSRNFRIFGSRSSPYSTSIDRVSRTRNLARVGPFSYHREIMAYGKPSGGFP